MALTNPTDDEKREYQKWLDSLPPEKRRLMAGMFEKCSNAMSVTALAFHAASQDQYGNAHVELLRASQALQKCHDLVMRLLALSHMDVSHDQSDQSSSPSSLH